MNELDSKNQSRKKEHLQIVLENDVRSSLITGLSWLNLTHEALPEINLSEVDTSTTLFGKRLKAPILISSMTGGTEQSKLFNIQLATAAQKLGIAMGVGSQRIAIEDQAHINSFQVRKQAPDVLLFANLGAIQLNNGFGVDECKKAVDMIDADALILHLNPLQEALQPDGNTNFYGLAKYIELVCNSLTVPVVVKEVGWGISPRTAKILAETGVAAIDVAGAGGTSWSEVERYRLTNPSLAKIAGEFIDWGISTLDSIQNVRENAPEVLIFASGGILNGVDATKCLCLGANLVGFAHLLLQAASEGEQPLNNLLEGIVREIMLSMFCTGTAKIEDLNQSLLIDRRNNGFKN